MIETVESDYKIDRVDGLPFGRAYRVTNLVTGDVTYAPSVTTVLAVIPDHALDEIRASIIRDKGEDAGKEYFEKLRIAGAGRGTVMHRYLEMFLTDFAMHRDPERALLYAQDNIEADRLANGWDKRMMDRGRNLFYNFYNQEFWLPIKRVLFNELFMFTTFRGGWAGAMDFVFEDNDGKIVVWDFKSSSSAKDAKKIPKYFLQVAAYMFLYSEMYNDGKIPDRGEIWMANDMDSQLQKFDLPRSEMKHYLKQFIAARADFDKNPDWQKFIEHSAKLAN